MTCATSLASRVRALEANHAFCCDLLGLVLSDEGPTTLWRHGLEEACHHSLMLKLGEPSTDRVGMRVLTGEELDLPQAHFAGAGFPTEWVEAEHQDRTLHTTASAGTPLEFRESLDFYNGMGSRLSECVVEDGNLELPNRSDKPDVEAELVVIGKAATNVHKKPLDHVAGYCYLNDGSVRDCHRKSSQWTIGRNLDQTGASSTDLVTPDEFLAAPRVCESSADSIAKSCKTATPRT